MSFSVQEPQPLNGKEIAMAFLWAKLASIAAPKVPEDSTEALQQTGKHETKKVTACKSALRSCFHQQSRVLPTTEVHANCIMHIPAGDYTVNMRMVHFDE